MTIKFKLNDKSIVWIIFIVLMIVYIVGFGVFMYRSSRVQTKPKEQYVVEMEKVIPCSVSFLTQSESQQFLKNDNDNYGRSLNKPNLIALGVDNNETLLEKWGDSASEFSDEEKSLLKDACFYVDKVLHLNSKSKTMNKQMLSIPWIFAKTIAPYYLDGLPHTRNNVIWLTDRIMSNALNARDVKILSKLLLHEKTHIWERAFPMEMQEWIHANGFEVVGTVYDDVLYRRNPDLDNNIYKNRDRVKLEVKFRDETPFDLHDVVFSVNSKNEHPYEILAYNIEKLVYENIV